MVWYSKSLTSHSTQYIGHFGDGGPDQWCTSRIQ